LTFLHARVATAMVLFAAIAGAWGIVDYYRHRAVSPNFWGVIVVGELNGVPMKRLLILTICLFSLAGCAPVTQVEGMQVTTETATAFTNRLPVILKQETPTPTQTPYDLPDLTIPYGYRIVYDDPCPHGSPGTITVTVQNIGTNHAGPFVAALNAQETSFNGLLAGASTPLASHFISGPVGSIYAEADTQNQVVESNEGNNIFRIIFRIKMTPPGPCVTPTPTHTPTPTFTPESTLTPEPATATPTPTWTVIGQGQ